MSWPTTAILLNDLGSFSFKLMVVPREKMHRNSLALPNGPSIMCISFKRWNSGSSEILFFCDLVQKSILQVRHPTQNLAGREWIDTFRYRDEEIGFSKFGPVIHGVVGLFVEVTCSAGKCTREKNTPTCLCRVFILPSQSIMGTMIDISTKIVLVET